MTASVPAQTIGQRLKLARETFSLFRAELAAGIGRSEVEIWEIEEGHAQPDAQFLQRLAQVYGLRPEWLQTGQGTACAVRSADGLPLSAVYRISIWGDEELPSLVRAIQRDLVAMGIPEVNPPPTVLFYWCLANWPEVSKRIAKDLDYCRRESFPTLNEYWLASMKAQLAARETNGGTPA